MGIVLESKDSTSENKKNNLNDIDDVEKVFLILLEADGGEAIPSNLWLQKEIFMIAKNLKKLEDYLNFQPYNKGPYSETVENILDNLQFKGYVKKENSKIKITHRGKELVKKIYEIADEDLLDLIEDIKRFMNDLTKNELLLYIHETYPEMTAQSVLKEDIEEDRVKLAKNMYRKEKISLEKASELARLSVSSFKSELND